MSEATHEEDLSRVNEAVARKLGWCKIAIPHDPNDHVDFMWLGSDKKTHEPFPRAYSTDIKAAWEIVASQPDWYFLLMKSEMTGGWKCDFGDPEETVVVLVAETAPLAICKAFLAL